MTLTTALLALLCSAAPSPLQVRLIQSAPRLNEAAFRETLAALIHRQVRPVTEGEEPLKDTDLLTVRIDERGHAAVELLRHPQVDLREVELSEDPLGAQQTLTFLAASLARDDVDALFPRKAAALAARPEEPGRVLPTRSPNATLVSGFIEVRGGVGLLHDAPSVLGGVAGGIEGARLGVTGDLSLGVLPLGPSARHSRLLPAVLAEVHARPGSAVFSAALGPGIGIDGDIQGGPVRTVLLLHLRAAVGWSFGRHIEGRVGLDASFAQSASDMQLSPHLAVRVKIP